MEKYYRQTVGSPVLTSAGESLTRVRDIILDVDTGRVVGFFVMKEKDKVVAPSDILEWNSTIVVHDANDIVEADEVIKIAEVLEKGVTLMKKKVYTKSGDYVGKVLDYGMNNKFFELTCIITAQSFLGLIFWDRRIIAAKDIIEIKEDRVIVKDLVTPVEMEKFQVDMAAG